MANKTKSIPDHTSKEQPRGRFAPTPSGPLHFGSLVTAVASYCQIKSLGGEWLLRIDDVDTPRVQTGAIVSIIETLQAFGFEWDGEIVYQSQRFADYQQALDSLSAAGLIYACECSRKQLHQSVSRHGPLGLIYPGTCRNKNLQAFGQSLRLNLKNAGSFAFTDECSGTLTQSLESEIGDTVMKRRDTVFSYHLSVVVDDALDNISHVVRGADLLESTPLHCHLQKLLGYPQPHYLHLPVVLDERGKKLSKQTGAAAINITQASSLLIEALKYLGQTLPEPQPSFTPKEILQSAVSCWDNNKLTKTAKCRTINRG